MQRASFAVLIIIVLSACQAPVERGAAEQPVLEPLPALTTAGAEHYIVRPDLSKLHILVYREGPLARYGHNHVVSAAVRGDVYLHTDFPHSGFALALALDDLVVDDPDARAEEGGEFAAELSAQAAAATAEHMLSAEGLDVARYPAIDIRSVEVSGPPWLPDIRVRIGLHGVEREISVPTSIHLGERQLVASGYFELLQSDFGITPYSVLGGGLRVGDRIAVRFRILAERE